MFSVNEDEDSKAFTKAAFERIFNSLTKLVRLVMVNPYVSSLTIHHEQSNNEAYFKIGERLGLLVTNLDSLTELKVSTGFG